MPEKDIFEQEVEKEEKEQLCVAKTSSGESCNNKAVYPPENPVVCHIKSHQEQVEGMDLEEEDEKKEKPKPKKPEAEKQPAIFSSKRANHKLNINLDNGGILKVRFENGRYISKSDWEADVIEEFVNDRRYLKEVIDRVQ